MEEKSNVNKLTQKDYQKKYDEKTQSVTIKYTPADMSDFDRMMKYLDRTGKSRSSFIKELINDFFESGKDKKHVVFKENEKAEYFKFEFIDDEDLDKLKLLLNNDNKYNRTALAMMRNLSPGELIYANSMVAEEIALENKEKMLEGTLNSHEVRKKDGCVQMDTPQNNVRDRSTNTREQVAKMSGVGTGTVARYDAIMLN